MGKGQPQISDIRSASAVNGIEARGRVSRLTRVLAAATTNWAGGWQPNEPIAGVFVAVL